MSIHNLNRTIYKRKALQDIINAFEDETNNANNEYFKHAMPKMNEDSDRKLYDTHQTSSFERKYKTFIHY